jgi:uncharacterized membrane protein (UPF0136 family)
MQVVLQEQGEFNNSFCLRYSIAAFMMLWACSAGMIYCTYISSKYVEIMSLFMQVVLQEQGEFNNSFCLRYSIAAFMMLWACSAGMIYCTYISSKYVEIISPFMQVVLQDQGEFNNSSRFEIENRSIYETYLAEIIYLYFLLMCREL